MVQAVEACLDQAQASSRAALQALFKRCVSDLTALTALVRGKLSSLERKVSKRIRPCFHTLCICYHAVTTFTAISPVPPHTPHTRLYA